MARSGLESFREEIIKPTEKQAGQRSGEERIASADDHAYRHNHRVVGRIERAEHCEIGAAVGRQDKIHQRDKKKGDGFKESAGNDHGFER